MLQPKRRTHGANEPFSTLQIGYIVASSGQPKSGSERYYFDLLRELPSVGVTNSGLVLGDLAAMDHEAQQVESFAPESGVSPSTRIKRLRSAVRRMKPQVDMIVAHAAEHALPVLDIIGRKRLVVHFQGPRALEYKAEGESLKRVTLARIAEFFTYARADRFIVLSEAFAEILCKHYHVSRKRVRIVPGAVDLQRFYPQVSRQEARARLGWPPDRPIALAVRRLAATKGLENLIDSIVLVKQQVPNVVVALVGGGPLRAALESRVARLGLADHVRFEGLMPEELLRHAYRAADVSIVPSVELEGFGLSIVESLACGTAALVTPVAGLPEVVRDLDPSLILDGSAPADLARGLVKALLDPQSLPNETRCLDYVQRFSWTSIVARVREVYREALDG
jgi:glycosyltransferase involved in cell wall biosynthesis